MTEVLRSNPAAAPADALGLRRLVDHGLWANLQWVECVYGQADPEVRPRELLGHLMVGERAWFERIEGAQRTTVMFPLLTRPELAQGFADNAESSRRLIDSHLEDVVIHFRRATARSITRGWRTSFSISSPTAIITGDSSPRTSRGVERAIPTPITSTF